MMVVLRGRNIYSCLCRHEKGDFFVIEREYLSGKCTATSCTRLNSRWCIAQPSICQISYTYSSPNHKVAPRFLAMRRFSSDDPASPPPPPATLSSCPKTPGCIYDPFRDELFTATRGHGAFLNGLQMKVGDQATIGEATVACGAPPGVLALGPCVRGTAALAPHVRTTRMLGSAGEGKGERQLYI